MNKVALSVCALAVLNGVLDAQQPGADRPVTVPTSRGTSVDSKAFDFNAEKVGATPSRWTVAETNSGGAPATWKVEAVKDDAKRKQAVKVETANKEAVFNLLMSEDKFAADLTLRVQVLSGTGEDDQGGGVLWRAKDANNYYVTRWNPLEKNLRVYKVEAGKRTMLKSADIEADAKAWHEISVTHHGSKIAVSFDGKVVAEAEDAAMKDAGKIGLWTKADASTWFDDVDVSTKK